MKDRNFLLGKDGRGVLIVGVCIVKVRSGGGRRRWKGGEGGRGRRVGFCFGVVLYIYVCVRYLVWCSFGE